MISADKLCLTPVYFCATATWLLTKLIRKQVLYTTWIRPVLFSPYRDLRLICQVLNSPTLEFSYIILIFNSIGPVLNWSSCQRAKRANVKRGRNFPCIQYYTIISLYFSDLCHQKWPPWPLICLLILTSYYLVFWDLCVNKNGHHGLLFAYTFLIVPLQLLQRFVQTVFKCHSHSRQRLFLYH